MEATVLTAIGTGVSTYGQFQAAKGVKRAARYNQQVAERNAKVAEQKAEIALFDATRNAVKFRKDFKL